MSFEKVLIVEDEENERSGMAELISAWGYRTETARDGLEGLEKVGAWTPGIVVTDLKMPRMDGMELLEKIATSPQEVAVILLTAQGSGSSDEVGRLRFHRKAGEPDTIAQHSAKCIAPTRHGARVGSNASHVA